MRMIMIISIAAISIAVPAAAQSPRDCGSLWKEVDVDSDGSLSAKEDLRGYSDALRAANFQTLEPGVISRDEFMLYCEGNLDRSSAGARQHKGQSGPIDRGKGDLTPGLIPFPKNEAIRRLEASGFREVGELELDKTGIWRTTALVGGKRVPVAVDVQGEILTGG